MTTINNGESGLSVRNKLNNVLQHADGSASEFVINDAGADVNLRVESDTKTHALFVDGGTGSVGIGTSSPDAELHVEDATGNAVVQIESSATGVSGIFLGDVNDGDVGQISYDHSDNSMRFGTNAVAERMRIDSAGNVGIGTSAPTAGYRMEVNGCIGAIFNGATESTLRLRSNTGSGSYLNLSEAGIAFMWSVGTTGGFSRELQFRSGASSLSDGTERMRITSSGNVGIGTSSPSQKLDVSGNVTISGSLSKGSGSFKIDHPIKPDTHYLIHSFIEGPQADNLYRGKVSLVDGSATVNLDEAGRMTEGTFVALNGNVQCFTTNEDGWTQIRGKVEGNILTIEAKDPACTDEVSWLVIGERHDQHMIGANWTDEQGRVITEPEKGTAS